MRVGFIGLGDQGAPMAARIMDGGFDLRVWARRPEVLEQWRASGAEIARSPRELAEFSDLIAVCVGGDSDVEEVMTGANGVIAGATSGSIIVIHSTVAPETCHKLARLAAAHGAHVIDAPVSGTGEAARAGNLVVIVGGEQSEFEACLPVFQTYGEPIIHMGPLGSAQLAKLINNVVVIANESVATDGLALGRAFGVDEDRLLKVLKHGTARSFALDVIRTPAFTGRRRSVTASLMKKDLALLDCVANQANARPLIDHLLALGTRMHESLTVSEPESAPGKVASTKVVYESGLTEWPGVS